MESQVRQNFHREGEAAINCIVNLELRASYVFTSMSCYFDRDDVALRHIAQFLMEQSYEHKEHAEKFLQYQNKRGGRIVLQDVEGKGSNSAWHHTLLLCVTTSHRWTHSIKSEARAGQVGEQPGGPAACSAAGEDLEPRPAGPAQGGYRAE
ncbi:ferritin heavy chain A isoform X2 [Chelonia mydas]|uniref:ferritin heavy chain A isoform X2 n=1 Tax=Chelonia mydas TaxID=8469 RepID=UPI001CAA02D8|nr:ferritin heavy chain A isoform X2 [Chelonia mydas]